MKGRQILEGRICSINDGRQIYILGPKGKFLLNIPIDSQLQKLMEYAKTNPKRMWKICTLIIFD